MLIAKGAERRQRWFARRAEKKAARAAARAAASQPAE
jgi:hypothetical protein